MRSQVALAAVAVAMLVPSGASGANPGSDDAGACGAYHGMFGLPAHGFLRDFVPVFARDGVYKGGFVGDNASNPACHD
jgi:hypothetical protein